MYIQLTNLYLLLYCKQMTHEIMKMDKLKFYRADSHLKLEPKDCHVTRKYPGP